MGTSTAVVRMTGRNDLMSHSTPLEYESLGTARAAGEIEPRWLGLGQTAWVKIGVITILFAALFWPNLRRLWEKTNPFTGEANWGHAMGVPIIGLYYLYLNRDKLLAARAKTSWWGLIWLVLGVLLFLYGIYPGQNDFVKDFGMVVTLFGVVLLLAGGDVMKIAWFPIAFLVCAIPWPGLLYSKVAGPLQSMAAQVAVWVLQVSQVKAFAGGTKIVIYGHNDVVRTLNVAEACAGLRSLMTFVSIGAALAFLLWSFRPLWQKLLITASAVPIAIFCNVMRVSGQGLLDRYVSPELSESFAHQFVGLIMMIPAFFLLLAVGWTLDQMLIQDIDEKQVMSRGLVRRSRAARVVPPPPVRTLRARAAGAPDAYAPVEPAEKNPAPSEPAVAGPASNPPAAPPRATPIPPGVTRLPPRTPLAPGRANSRLSSGSPRRPGAIVPPPMNLSPQRNPTKSRPTGTEDA